MGHGGWVGACDGMHSPCAVRQRRASTTSVAKDSRAERFLAFPFWRVDMSLLSVSRLSFVV